MAEDIRWISASEVAANYAPIGGGGGALLAASVTLTNAEIISSPSTYISVIEPTEVLDYSGFPETIPVPLLAIATLRNIVPYSGADGGTCRFRLVYGSDWSLDNSSCLYNNNGTLTELAADSILQGNGQPYCFQFNFSPADNGSLNEGSLKDNGLYFVIDNSDDLGDGGSENSLTIDVYYVLKSFV